MVFPSVKGGVVVKSFYSFIITFAYRAAIVALIYFLIGMAFTANPFSFSFHLPVDFGKMGADLLVIFGMIVALKVIETSLYCWFKEPLIYKRVAKKVTPRRPLKKLPKAETVYVPLYMVNPRQRLRRKMATLP